jgi:predicted nucleic acid-binding Zn ribbon protein
MPTYVYGGCELHGNENGEFEVTQSIKDAALTQCPHCVELKVEKPRTVKRLIAMTSFVLNGSGWFRDGYTSK